MSNHEYFQELSALSAIGQISSQEERELAEHLRECGSCSDVHLGYARVIQQQLPHADAIRWRMKSTLPALTLDTDIRTRFLARARVDGIDFSPEAERTHNARSSLPSHILQLQPALAITLLAVFAIVVMWVGRAYQLVPRPAKAPVDRRFAQVSRENDDLRGQLVALRQTVEEKTTRIGLIKKQNADSVRSQQGLQEQLDGAQKQVEKLSAILRQTESEKSELLRASQEEHATISNLHAQSDNLYREQAGLLSSRAVLEEQVRSLTATLQEKTADLDSERQSTALNRDMSQLMGARNLHIMDVHKVGEDGRAAKAYGRVFYAQGQSLVFYAFDLPSGGLNPTKYTFQGWGQREPEPQSVRNLGTFEADGHEQRRWVLKVSDPTLLVGIDSVFVTSELLRDSKKPHGRQLMYAYIAGKSNRP